MTQMIQLRLGDCIDRLTELPTGSVAAFVMDLPYARADAEAAVMIELDPFEAIATGKGCQVADFSAVKAQRKLSEVRPPLTWGLLTM